MKLLRVKYEEEHWNQSVTHTGDENEINHGKRVPLELVRTWMQINQLVCANSNFTSFMTANLLYKKGVWFTVVVKTVTTKSPVHYLNIKQMYGRGDYHSVVTTVEEKDR